MNLSSLGLVNTDDYFPSLHFDRGAADVNMARKIIKPEFSRPSEIRVSVLSQEYWLTHHRLSTQKAQNESFVSVRSERLKAQCWFR